DEKIDVVATLGTRREGPEARSGVDAMFRDGDTRREASQIEEIPTAARQLLNLLRRDVGRDFGRPHLDCWGAFDGHRLQLDSSGLKCKVDAQRGADLHCEHFALGAETDLANRKLVSGGPQ